MRGWMAKWEIGSRGAGVITGPCEKVSEVEISRKGLWRSSVAVQNRAAAVQGCTTASVHSGEAGRSGARVGAGKGQHSKTSIMHFPAVSPRGRSLLMGIPWPFETVGENKKDNC